MKAEGMTDAAAERAKKYFSADEIKSGGMVWRTIRGNRVLIKPLPGGGGVVVGGAEGKLNHFRIDLSTTKETYEQARHVKTEESKAAEKEKVEGMALDDRKKYVQEKRKGMKIKKQAGLVVKKQYETTIEKIMKEGSMSKELTDTIKADAAKKVEEALAATGLKLPEGIDPDSVNWGEGGTKFEEFVQRASEGVPAAMKVDAKEMAQAAADAAVHTHLKDIEREAVEVLARHVSGESYEPGMKITAEQLDEETKTAMSIMKARQTMRRELKQVEKGEGAIYISKINVSKALTKAELNEVPDAEIQKQVEGMIETQKNIELYDRMDEQKLANQKFVDQGSADSFNGIIGDMFGAGTVFDADLVRNIGVEGIARALATKVNEMGKTKEVTKALENFFEKNRVKIVDEALAESTRRRGLKKNVMKSIGSVNDSAAMEDWVNAMRFCQRQTSAESRSLGTAVGSLRAVSHMINALNEPARQEISFPTGDNIDEAKARMRRAGLNLKDGDYKVEMVSGKATVTMPAAKIEKMVDSSKQAILTNKRINDIKAGKLNDGYMPPGMADTFKDKTGTSTQLKLKAAQESCVRLFKETGRFLADQEAGLGKTGIMYASAMEAYHNMGDKKILIVVPANLREQAYGDSKMWLNPEMQKLVHHYSDKGGLTGRIEQYKQEGIHIIGHEQLRTDSEALKAAGFGAIFVDEAHRLTSPEGDAAAAEGASQQYAGLMQLQGVRHKVMLSGTNIKNSVDELYKKINWLDPDHKLGTMEDFNKRYENENQGTGIFQSAAVEAFRKDVSPYVFSQKNPLKVAQHENTLHVDISDKQKVELRRINEAFHADSDKASASSRRDSEIYKVLYDGGPDNPRIQAAIKQIDEHHVGEKVVWHMRQKNAIKSVKEALEKKYGPGCVRLIVGEGDVGLSEGEKKSNEKNKEEFMSDPKARFLLGTSALSTGHNGLQNVATTQINFDRPYTYAEQAQRNASLYRTGQDKDVNTYYMSSYHPYDVQAEDIVETKRRRGEMMGNPRDVEGWDDSGFLTYLQRYGFFESPKKEAVA
jgi:SNF2 family DNA or RNA helicase